MEGRVIIQGVQTLNPDTAPEDIANVRQLACNNRGVLWVSLTAADVELEGVPDNTDLVSPVATNINLRTASRNYGWDGASGFWRRISALTDAFGAISPGSAFCVRVISIPVLLNNTNTFYMRQYVGDSTSVGNQSGEGAALTTLPGEWAIHHTPAVATRATISQAAVSGRRHVLKGFSAFLNCVAAVTVPVQVVVRDGATGAGTILWSGRLTGLAGTTVQINREGLNLVGSVNTAMTVEFVAAPAAGDFQTVDANGYTASA